MSSKYLHNAELALIDESDDYADLGVSRLFVRLKHRATKKAMKRLSYVDEPSNETNDRINRFRRRHY